MATHKHKLYCHEQSLDALSSVQSVINKKYYLAIISTHRTGLQHSNVIHILTALSGLFRWSYNREFCWLQSETPVRYGVKSHPTQLRCEVWTITLPVRCGGWVLVGQVWRVQISSPSWQMHWFLSSKKWEPCSETTHSSYQCHNRYTYCCLRTCHITVEEIQMLS